MPRKRPVVDRDSDNDNPQIQPTKRNKVDSKEFVATETDEDDLHKTTPKARYKKQTQKNTLHNYFVIDNSKDEKKVFPNPETDKREKAILKVDDSSVLRQQYGSTSSDSPVKQAEKSFKRNVHGSTELTKHRAVSSKTKSPDSSEHLRTADQGRSISVCEERVEDTAMFSHTDETKRENRKRNVKARQYETGEISHHNKRLHIQDSEVVLSSSGHETMCTEEKKKADNSFSKGHMAGDRRRSTGTNYISFLNREGPRQIGSRDIPQGTPNCLHGMTFVITGVIESMERDDAKVLIERCGGKVTTNVSKKTSFIIVGREPGSSKINKAEELKIKRLNEDELFDLIHTKSAHSASKSLELRKLAVKDDESDDTDIKPKCLTNAKVGPSPITERKTSPIKLNNFRANLVAPDNEETLSQLGKISTYGTLSSVARENQLWVDKYRPQSLKHLIGQQSSGSIGQKLLSWLRSWHRHLSNGTKKSGSVGFTRGFRDDGSLFKAALLSGPPGIGKTTTASLVCQELGFSFFELNASDTRSKRSLQEQVAEAIGNHSMIDFLRSSNADTGKCHCLLMDEVDGMAGNEDRGGIAELIQLIKQSKIPIICMCNNRNHQKMRSLVNYCFDLRFQRPRLDQIKGALMSLAFKEGLKIQPSTIVDIIKASNNDIRQAVNNLEMWTASNKNIREEQIQKNSSKGKKDIRFNTFELIRKILSPEQSEDVSIRGRSDLFFQDYQMGPLFVQENYLNVCPRASGGNQDATLALISKAADAIALGDLVSRTIRTSNNWSLLTTQAVFSSILPGHYMNGNFTSSINFPSWLGRNSSHNRCARLLQQLATHIRLPTGGVQPSELAMGSGQNLLHHVTSPLIRNGCSGVNASLRIINCYDLLREDLDILADCTVWPNQKNPLSSVDSKVKSALTRAYNKASVMSPYSLGNSTLKKKRFTLESNYQEDDQTDDERLHDNENTDEENDNLTTDPMLKRSKAKKQTCKSFRKTKTKTKGKEERIVVT